MKIESILQEEQQLNEINFRKALAGVVASAALAGGVGKGVEALHPDSLAPRQEVTQTGKQSEPLQVPDRISGALQQLAKKYKLTPDEAKKVAQVSQKYDVIPEAAIKILDIMDRYGGEMDMIADIVKLSYKYAKPTYPKVNDILALIGVESGFDPTSVSGLSKDPAVGLTQVRPKMWGIEPSDLKGNIELQIKTGSDILHHYFKKVKNPQEALKAYNVGLTNYRNGVNSEAQERYLSKNQKEKRNFF
jgi:soluble lytic murein transglycosylase-like protein